MSGTPTYPAMSRIDELNSTLVPLGAGETYTGTWVECWQHASISVMAKADVAGTLWMDFSIDAATQDRSVRLSGSAADMGIHALIPVGRYYRVRVVNGAGAQASLRVQSLLCQYPRVATATSRASQTVGDYNDVLNVRVLTDPLLDEALSRQADRAVVQKFGANPNVAAGSEEDIWSVGGTYPWPTSALAVRIKAGGNAADDAAGAGAQSVTVVGLDDSWAEASETIATAGAGASAATTTLFVRLFRAYVANTGTYGGDNTGNIDIETTAGTTLARIGLTTGAATGVGQTELALYTVPAGKVAYCRRVAATVEGAKAADVYFWQRENADDVTTPFTARRTWHTVLGLSGTEETTFASYAGPFPAKTDIWVSAIGPAGGGAVSASFDLVLVDL